MVKLKNSRNKRLDAHLVYITDEAGVFDAFKQIKNVLVLDSNLCLSFIYVISNRGTHLLFEQELNILEKRFSQKLLIYKVTIQPETNCLDQEFLEALINSNTSEEIKFSLFGNAEFVTQLSDILNFLGIKSFVLVKIIK